MGDALSIRGAARALGIGRDTIRAAITANELAAYKLGPRTIRILRSDLEEWRDRHRVGPAGASEAVVARVLAREEKRAAG